MLLFRFVGRVYRVMSNQLHSPKDNEWESHWSDFRPVTRKDLKQLEHRLRKLLMTYAEAIAAFAAAQSAFNDRQDAAVTGLQGDVKNLEDQIAALQASPGQITAADQATLDAIQARASAIADKLDALDALTPPVVPPATP